MSGSSVFVKREEDEVMQTRVTQEQATAIPEVKREDGAHAHEGTAEQNMAAYLPTPSLALEDLRSPPAALMA
ncbi:hypothetical protein JCM8547_005491 [Rhodosporidiobolus lusitaniae]